MNLDSYETLVIGMVGVALIVGLVLSAAGAGVAAVAGGIFGAIVWIVVWAGLRMRSRSDAMG